jgi:hypothetical protein
MISLCAYVCDKQWYEVIEIIIILNQIVMTYIVACV